MTRSTPDQNKEATELAFSLLFDGSQDSRSKFSFIKDLHSFLLISLIFIVFSLMFIDFL